MDVRFWSLSELNGRFHSTSAMHSTAETGSVTETTAAADPKRNFEDQVIGPTLSQKLLAGLVSVS